MSIHQFNNDAHNFRRSAQWDQAIAQFTAMLDAPEKEQTEWSKRIAHTCIALCYRQQGKIDDAIREFTTVIALSTAHPAAYFYRGCAYLAQKKQADAIADFQQYVAKFDAGSDLLEAVFAYPIDVQIADRDCSTAIDEGIDKPMLYFMRGLSRHYLRDFYRAIEDFQRASKDSALSKIAQHASLKSNEASLRVNPADKQLMKPDMEYCLIIFDGDNNQSDVTYFDQVAQRKESSHGEVFKRIKSQGWKEMGRNSHKEGYTSYLQRSTNATGILGGLKKLFGG